MRLVQILSNVHYRTISSTVGALFYHASSSKASNVRRANTLVRCCLQPPKQSPGRARTQGVVAGLVFQCYGTPTRNKMNIYRFNLDLESYQLKIHFPTIWIPAEYYCPLKQLQFLLRIYLLRIFFSRRRGTPFGDHRPQVTTNGQVDHPFKKTDSKE